MKMTLSQTCERLARGKPTAYARARFLLAIVLLVMAMNTVAEAECWEDSLKEVNRNTLVTASNAIYRVVPEDQSIVAFWLPPARITICESVTDLGMLRSYLQIRNWDQAVTVWATQED